MLTHFYKIKNKKKAQIFTVFVLLNDTPFFSFRRFIELESSIIKILQIENKPVMPQFD